MDLLKDKCHKTSSKRVAGFIALGFFAAFSVLSVLSYPESVQLIGAIWGSLVLGLFGATTLEKNAQAKDISGPGL